MALPETRQQLIDWCLKKLGAPVLEINLDDLQIEDRVDEAIAYFNDYHFDGVERLYIKHIITASCVKLDVPATSNDWKKNDVLVGNISQGEVYVYDISSDLLYIRFKKKTGELIPGETATNQRTGETVTLSSLATDFMVGDIDRGYLNLHERIIGVIDIKAPESSTIGGAIGGMFDFQYQWSLNNMFNLASTDLVTYDIYKRYISLWEFMFRGMKGLRFNRVTNKLYIDVQNWNLIDQFIILEVLYTLDPNDYKKVYSNEFVREYCYSLIKLQWGNNLKKYNNIALPGGVTLNGQAIYDEAKEEIKELRERIRKEFEMMPNMVIG
jgi:hypothetical protein